MSRYLIREVRPKDLPQLHELSSHLNSVNLPNQRRALKDAITGAGVNAIEIHLTNVHAREAYRRKSIIAQACIGSINGFGAGSYILGLEAAILHNKTND